SAASASFRTRPSLPRLDNSPNGRSCFVRLDDKADERDDGSDNGTATDSGDQGVLPDANAAVFAGDAAQISDLLRARREGCDRVMQAARGGRKGLQRLTGCVMLRAEIVAQGKQRHPQVTQELVGRLALQIGLFQLADQRLKPIDDGWLH